VSDRGYIPALRFRALTPLYDRAIRWTTRERSFKERLLDAARPAPGERVLDLGCGTGTLAIMIKEAEPRAEVFGVDADPDILARAREKAERAGYEIAFDEGLAQRLPYEDESLDVVVSSLFFHHLETAAKERTAAEIARVLRPNGRLHVADWGQASDPLMRALALPVRLLDGFAPTRDNVNGRLPQVLSTAGLSGAAEIDRLRTAFGTLSLYRATVAKPAR
jgi:ubiquinone/menaquinone biosynthesis C-methylase UbiE